MSNLNRWVELVLSDNEWIARRKKIKNGCTVLTNKHRFRLSPSYPANLVCWLCSCLHVVYPINNRSDIDLMTLPSECEISILSSNASTTANLSSSFLLHTQALIASITFFWIYFLVCNHKSFICVAPVECKYVCCFRFWFTNLLVKVSAMIGTKEDPMLTPSLCLSNLNLLFRYPEARILWTSLCCGPCSRYDLRWNWVTHLWKLKILYLFNELEGIIKTVNTQFLPNLFNLFL